MTKLRLMTIAAAVAAVVLTGTGTVPQASAAVKSRPAAAACTTAYEVTGRSVAVRRPARGEAVARANSRVVRVLHRGDRVTSCLEAVARTVSGPAYRKCGRDGHVWRVVRGPQGGQVPATCLKRL
ncbi:hypothetical protein ACIPSE_47170 [Streptomyces sp. NPDC090106]|uniref:hypothetical protein n=1 Tax=Streptomyces sp. NPDC090106 TaxID=3365946 RepID=UPI00381B60C0